MQRVFLLPFVLLLAGCGSNRSSGAVTPAVGSGWRSLFDGTTTAAWRGYKKDSLPAGWQVVDGALGRVAKGAGDIITKEQYDSFELLIDWKISPGGNSGIMYHVVEDSSETYFSGPEMQVLDDAGHRDGQSRLTSAGAAYGLYPAPAGVVKPAREWNHVRLVVNGPHVEHWLNGVKLCEYELWSADWNARIAASKFKAWPGFGEARTGHIALQDHGDRVAYRNIRIKVLP